MEGMTGWRGCVNRVLMDREVGARMRWWRYGWNRKNEENGRIGMGMSSWGVSGWWNEWMRMWMEWEGKEWMTKDEWMMILIILRDGAPRGIWEAHWVADPDSPQMGRIIWNSNAYPMRQILCEAPFMGWWIFLCSQIRMNWWLWSGG